MNELYSVIAVLAGIAARIAIPIFFTAVAVHLLRRLDAHWQNEAKTPSTQMEKPACWEICKCEDACLKSCPGYLSALPCWQARRSDNGYLREECLACKVFLQAPAGSLG